jgi:hypothetical protein
MPDRRQFLLGVAALLGMPAIARAAARSVERVHLAAAWQAGNGYQVGILEYALEHEGNLIIHRSLDVPTRAHGLLREPGGSVLAVARRPGDWLLRWSAEGKPLTWRWVEPGRAFAGHLLASLDGATLYTTEINLETGAGLIGVRDGATLAKLNEWPTYGIDPHQLLWDVCQPGAFVVANGGVPTRPETGRIKRNLDDMDSSLVRLDGTSGTLLDQWRLPDPRLSLRHLAWNGDRLGVALQAEHDDANAKACAPVLAVFDGRDLSSMAAPEPLAGYGGSIAAFADGFAVSCPRAQGVALFTAAGYQERIPLAEVCALVSASNGLWAGGLQHALMHKAGAPEELSLLPGIRLDNHWIELA